MKSQNFLILKLCLIFAALFNSACVEQTSSLASSPTETETEKLIAADTEIDAAQKIIEKMPDDAGGYNKLAAVYIRRARETGDFSLNRKAEIAVNRALEIEAENSDAKKLKASLLLTLHRFEEALEYGKQLQKTSPQSAFVYGVLTDANVELGNYKEAADAVQQMVDLRPNMESYARASHLRSLYGDSSGAIEAMNLAARVADPLDREAQAWCLTHLGKEYFKIGNFIEAEKQYDAALKILPEYHLALHAKADVRAANGDFENALKIYTELQNPRLIQSQRGKEISHRFTQMNSDNNEDKARV